MMLSKLIIVKLSPKVDISIELFILIRTAAWYIVTLPHTLPGTAFTLGVVP